MNEPTASEIVALLGIETSALPLVSGGNLDVASRGAGPRHCVACGGNADVVLIALSPLGNRWVDLCATCFAYGRSRGRK
ncbi:hypothetical protein Ais01nite_74640 [Asanoa ishikariensis]|uniref:Uncharacterized protein n=1 Tax=Asanoa ishikariensis TaxID=137265 RepID=A0A1H3US55_9ACTN|nr:hypothetical protein Ais01nite_74640 [Asanoa ishikariensis]SDZ65300.1 hypothetical protein SAMN05421684_7988 [Asanoa ishikariensis]